MSVAILLVTHEPIGNDMLKIISAIMNDDIENTACIDIPMDPDTEITTHQIETALNDLATEDGVLILTDSYGSTPFNLAAKFIHKEDRILVSGLNLPMLIRIMNYRTLSLDELKDKAVEGGIRGITARSD